MKSLAFLPVVWRVPSELFPGWTVEHMACGHGSIVDRGPKSRARACRLCSAKHACPKCGVTVEREDGRVQVYCGQKCRRAAWYDCVLLRRALNSGVSAVTAWFRLEERMEERIDRKMHEKAVADLEGYVQCTNCGARRPADSLTEGKCSDWKRCQEVSK